MKENRTDSSNIINWEIGKKIREKEWDDLEANLQSTKYFNFWIWCGSFKKKKNEQEIEQLGKHGSIRLWSTDIS